MRYPIVMAMLLAGEDSAQNLTGMWAGGFDAGRLYLAKQYCKCRVCGDHDD